MIKTRVLPVIFASFILSACSFVFSQAAPKLDKAACRVTIPEGVKAECYELRVPESRIRPNSRLITLPVVVIKSLSATPKSDPVVYTAGGPGVGSLGMVRGAGNLVPYIQDRDFIIFEQRGTQYAEPSLQCPEVTEALHSNWRSNRSYQAAKEAELEAVKECRTRLVQAGVDLASYNSVESAADLNDLRLALGTSRWNLYGISYSTRLMLNYVRAFPASVRSVILDSVLPPTANWDETGIDHVLASLNLIFRRCKGDKECNDKYPNLEGKFYSAVEKLDKAPATVEAMVDAKAVPVRIGGRDFVDLIYNLLEGSRSLAIIPWTIDAVEKGTVEPLKTYAENILTSSGFIWGMRYSVWCSEEMPFESEKKIADQIRKYPKLKGFSIQGAFPQICKIWNVPRAKPVENESVSANVPVLVFSGEFDPDTPPAWGRLVASWFKKGYFFEVKNTTHQAMNRRCTFVDIPIAFLNDPDVRPDGNVSTRSTQLSSNRSKYKKADVTMDVGLIFNPFQF